MDTLLRDVRYSLRLLFKSPGFTATALSTLALCLGANLAIFAIVDAVLLRPLPFPKSHELVIVSNAYPGAGVERSSASVPNYFDRRKGVKAFSSVSLYQDGSVVVGEAGAPNRVQIGRVSPEFFQTLGVPLAKGHPFTDEHLLYGADMVAILTDEYWRNRFNADPNVLGRTFLNDGLPVTVVGVLPPKFRFLSSRAQFFRPASHSEEQRKLQNRHSNNFEMIARLAPGVSVASAQAQMNAFNRQQLTDDPYPDLIKNVGFRTTVAPLHADHVRTAKPTLLLLQAAVLFLLMIGSVNLVNLLLIRSSARSKELAVRQALGAGHWQLAREVWTETTLLSMGGGVLGLCLGIASIGVLRMVGTDRIPLGATIAFDYRLALAALAGSLVVGTVLAAPVIWFNSRSKLSTVLQTESRSGTTSRAAHRMRHGFIIAQVAMAFVLLSGAGLLTTSLKRVLQTPPGFNPDNVLVGNISLPWKNYKDDAAQLAFIERLIPALRALPSVTHVAIKSGLPFTGPADDNATTVEGYTRAPGEPIRAHYMAAASADYVATMQIPLLRGRFLEDADNHREARVCVVDQAFADRYFPGKDPLGRRLASEATLNDMNASTIVGVVGNVKQLELAETPGHGAIYFPYKSFSPRYFSLVIRSGLPSEAIAPMVQKTVLQLDPELPVDDLRPMQALIDDTLLVRRAPALIAAVFAGVALLLAAMGTYGVLSYAVSQRQREIGVRMALGARPEQIRNQFVSIGVRVLAIGALAGTFGAWGAGRAMETVLFGVPSLHLTTLVLTLAVMGVVTLAASLVPAVRATKVNPISALRAD